MVYGFAKQSGGQVTISSEPGCGTTVQLYLPQAEAPVKPAGQEPATDAEGVESYLSARAGAPEGTGPAFAHAQSFGTRSRSRFFTVRAESRLESDAIYVREAVVALGGGRQQPYRLLSWKRGRLVTTPSPHVME